MELKNLKVTNYRDDRDDRDDPFGQVKFMNGNEVLATIDCSSDQSFPARWQPPELLRDRAEAQGLRPDRHQRHILIRASPVQSAGMPCGWLGWLRAGAQPPMRHVCQASEER
ncbi:hypothetical protein JNB_00325 [Janibacter sp. HTCC2649]|uniref:hypothetical protein n=1 Tax=Janibacter sp. HTCC2649 TaxID=313589 RepID=UPI000066ED07|nr:hypothetical protein [Janibacter sp. HTCC2649]EAP98567.1 hypothetical protein JNB_00325 [Janibacter sp. HTCC2649]